MANKQFAFGMIHVLALLVHVCTVATMSAFGASGFVVAEVSGSAASTISSTPDSLLSSITSSSSMGNWAPSATVTASASLTYSTRPAASGFWTGTDPFSFVPPTYLSSIRSSLTSIDKSSNVPSVSTTWSSSANTSSTNTETTSTNIVITTDASMTPMPVISASVSTHTSIVTASPVHTTASTDTSTNTASETPISTSTLQAGSYRVSIDPLSCWALLLLNQWFVRFG